MFPGTTIPQESLKLDSSQATSSKEITSLPFKVPKRKNKIKQQALMLKREEKKKNQKHPNNKPKATTLPQFSSKEQLIKEHN